MRKMGGEGYDIDQLKLKERNGTRPTRGEILLSKLRKEMKARNLDAFILLRDNAHHSEELAPCDERIAYLSGFTGSNAMCLVTIGNHTLDSAEALLWTDSRYYI